MANFSEHINQANHKLSEPLIEMIWMIDMIEIKGRGFRNRTTAVGTSGEREMEKLNVVELWSEYI
jgi:hypothetical protein